MDDLEDDGCQDVLENCLKTCEGCEDGHDSSSKSPTIQPTEPTKTDTPPASSTCPVGCREEMLTQSKQVSSICTTSKALGNTRLTSLTSSEQAGTLNTAAAGAKIQAIIDAINGFAAPDCSD